MTRRWQSNAASITCTGLGTLCSPVLSSTTTCPCGRLLRSFSWTMRWRLQPLFREREDTQRLGKSKARHNSYRRDSCRCALLGAIRGTQSSKRC
ncbi:hypothetical protein DPMN_074029 [Dreissena polymorpha]|uniref:Secreted protein n=1 Tax=Dreissena polymorpha TaxID=45954 RepID=A0A9D3YEG1_DREPO|nr:hypothetical protein DPMN_074029 [Dreissena polymorpha]